VSADLICPVSLDHRCPQRWLFISGETLRKSRFADEQMVAILRDAGRLRKEESGTRPDF
jgi:hypothetical protein